MVTPRLYKGMRDSLPETMIPREDLLGMIKKTFRSWGFMPVETPAIEFTDILLGSKYGSEAHKLIYHLQHDDGLALRYDLTVPLARMYAMNRRDLPTPFKRYQVQPVWRAERAQPKQGRFREFYQCDVDIIGSDSRLADAEIVALSAQIMKNIGFNNIVTQINHRKILAGVVVSAGFTENDVITVCQSIDKLDKINEDGVKKELVDKGFEEKNIEKLFDLMKNNLDDFLKMESDDIREGAQELKEFFDLFELFGHSMDVVQFTPTLARGLDYYTGIIFETRLPDYPHIGSVNGGGRYDNLIGTFSGQDIPAVGITVGLDRILVAAQEAGLLTTHSSLTDVMIVNFFDDTLKESVKVSTILRNNGISTELYLDKKKITKQFDYANKQGIPIVIVIGKDDVERGVVQIKIMKSGEQIEVKIDEILHHVKKILD